MKANPDPIRKITVNLPASLIDPLMRDSRRSLTDTIREALKEYRHRRACEALRAMRGKITFDLTYEEMKEDRE